MKKLLSWLFYNDIIRYLFFGGLTVLVNLASYVFFTELLHWSILFSNVLSIVIALLFAYITNTLFVFKNKAQSLRHGIAVFLKFISSRLFTMLLEIAGVALLVNIFFLDDLLAKTVLQGVVIITNYVLSKFFVYRH